MGEQDNYFAGWLPLDPDNLPLSSAGPFLTTNNTGARNAHGLPSHVFLVSGFHRQPDGDVSAFIELYRQAYGLRLYRPVFSDAGDTLALARRVAALNEKAGEVGAGMLAQLVAQARAALAKAEGR